MIVFCAVLVSLLVLQSTAFNYGATRTRVASVASSGIRMHFEEALVGNTALATGALPSERYIATNRFKVRRNQGPKFEKRWADRKSRLAKLDGFRFFTLLRRVEEYGADYSEEGEFGNYVSFTIWENKDCFDAWRTGEAFKEAHGGGGVTDFIKLLSTALFILDGGPKPAFYDTVLPLQGEKVDFEGEDGWRTVVADGENLLNADVFMSQNRFKVAEGKELAFEQRWAKRESKLNECPGFLGFFMQRRDATKADDGYNYVASTLWKDRSAFEAWRSSQQFSGSHGSGSKDGKETTEKPMNLFLSPPKLAFYEGKLALSSPKGV